MQNQYERDGLLYRVPFVLRTIIIDSSILTTGNWCRANCKGEFRYQYTSLVYWFELESDATMFRLIFG